MYLYYQIWPRLAFLFSFCVGTMHILSAKFRDLRDCIPLMVPLWWIPHTALMFLLLLVRQAVEQTVQLPVVSYTVMLMLCHCNIGSYRKYIYIYIYLFGNTCCGYFFCDYMSLVMKCDLSAIHLWQYIQIQFYKYQGLTPKVVPKLNSYKVVGKISWSSSSQWHHMSIMPSQIT